MKKIKNPGGLKLFKGVHIMNMNAISQLDSIEEVDAVISAAKERKVVLKEQEKEAQRVARKREKEAAMEAAKESIEQAGLEEGDNILVLLKGEEVEGQFVHLTESRLVVLVDGDKKALPFDKFLGTANKEQAAQEAV